MAGFGKKDMRATDLQKLMIIGATQVFTKEINLGGRPPSNAEIASIVANVRERQKMVLTEAEFGIVVAGTKRLAINRRYVEEIVKRWSKGRASLGYEDLRKAGEILDEAGRGSAARQVSDGG